MFLLVVGLPLEGTLLHSICLEYLCRLLGHLVGGQSFVPASQRVEREKKNEGINKVNYKEMMVDDTDTSRDKDRERKEKA